MAEFKTARNENINKLQNIPCDHAPSPIQKNEIQKTPFPTIISLQTFKFAAFSLLRIYIQRMNAYRPGRFWEDSLQTKAAK